MPDAVTHGLINHDNSHFKRTVCNGKKKLIDFVAFHAHFENEIESDDLYLGYYLHLIQDSIFRACLYYDYNYKVTCPEDIEVLHNDYGVLNTYLISKYHLENHFVIPEKFHKEEINTVYPFSLAIYLEDTKNDFLPFESGKTRVFTEKMADEYIAKSFELCKKELESIKAGCTNAKPMDYAWDFPVQS